MTYCISLFSSVVFRVQFPTDITAPLRRRRCHSSNFRFLCLLLWRFSAAHLVCSEPALSYATPLLRRLHWLPVARRITYKLCVLMFDVFHGTAPTYLTDFAVAAVTTVFDHQHAATSWCGGQRHASLTVRSQQCDFRFDLFFSFSFSCSFWNIF